MKASRLEDGELHVRDVDVPDPAGGRGAGPHQRRRRVPLRPPHRPRRLVRRAARPARSATRHRHRRGARTRRRALRGGRRPGDPRSRRHGRRLLVRRVRVLPQRPAPSLRAEQGRSWARSPSTSACGRRSLVKIPDELGDEEAPLACGGLTAYGAVKKLLDAPRPARAGPSRSSAPPAGSATTRCRSPRRSATGRRRRRRRGAARLRPVARRGHGGRAPTTRSTSCATSSAASTPAWCSRPGSPGSGSGFDLLGPHGLFVARRPPAVERGQPRVQPVRALPEGPDDHLLGGGHRAGHARARRTGGRGQGEEPRVAHRRALGARRHLRRARSRASTSAARSSPT